MNLLASFNLINAQQLMLANNEIIYGVGGAAAGGILVFLMVNMIASQKLKHAAVEAKNITTQANAEGENIKKQAELDTRNELAKLREESTKEISSERNEVKEFERRISKREDSLERKMDMLDTKEKNVQNSEQDVRKREQKVDSKNQQLDSLIKKNEVQLDKNISEQKQSLLKISGMSEDEAKKETLKVVEHEVRHEASMIIQKITDDAQDEAKENARKITLLAIQKYASEHTADSTVSAINIPSDDMKGRIIGREGRNIRAFEKNTGVDVIVDDTPGVIVVSCFDPVRRAVAADSMRKLIDDGRIHPTRIEEVVEQIREEIEEGIVKFGKDAAIEANIPGLHPKISAAMGRLHYRTSYGQNILRHSMEVAFLCQVIADELGLDGNLARRCGFLHDIGKAMDHDTEGGHPQIGMDFCKRYGEKEAVLNAVGGHHNDIPSTTPYTPIVMAADAISGARPGARRESMERYIKRLQELEEIATSMKGVRQAFAIQAGREVRVIVDPETVSDENCSYIARDIAKRVSEEMTFPGEIRVTVLREMRTIDYAK